MGPRSEFQGYAIPKTLYGKVPAQIRRNETVSSNDELFDFCWCWTTKPTNTNRPLL